MKDQIGSFAYFPSINFQKAAGGYGGIVINNRDVIPIPFSIPGGDITILISDWYINNHKVKNITLNIVSFLCACLVFY